MFDKLWEEHVIETLDDGRDVLFVDRHIVHDASSPQAFSDLHRRGQKVAFPDLTFATADHTVSTEIGRTDATVNGGAEMISALRQHTRNHGIVFQDLGDDHQGIVHINFPDLGVIQPGLTVCCGDSHTCTNGALGALALAIGTSEVTQVLATQSLFRHRPKTMCLTLHGQAQPGVYAKDIILHVIGCLGSDGARGHAVEFRGEVVAEMSVEERFTLCNMAAEMGAATALIAPDKKTFAYLSGRPFAPSQNDFAQAMQHWKSLRSDDSATFDRTESFYISELAPQVTWGTSPDQVMAIDACLPLVNEGSANAGAMQYMGLASDEPIVGLPVDVVFIGSCTNGRISDLRIAAQAIAGHKIARGVRGIVVPGSTAIRLQAESEGLATTFRQAGFEWRQSGCSMCAALNLDRLAPGQRAISTSNRNYQGRQGAGSLTHLASPATAAACAIAGVISDPRKLGIGQ